MDVFLLPFIFSFRAAISFLLLIQATLTMRNVGFLFQAILQTIQKSIQWIGFLCWLFVSSYTGRFWILILRWLFIVPITFITFFGYVYNFGPKHRKRSLFDILCNPVPGVEFDGRVGESEDFVSLERRRFNHNLVARRIARNKHLSAKRASRSISSNIYDCPMAYIDPRAPIISGYQTYATFHDTSSENAVLESEFSMPMTLYFAICEYSCPEIIFSSLPRRPPDGIFTSFIISSFIGFIFAAMTIRTCFKLSRHSLQIFLVAEIQAAIRQTDRPIEGTSESHTHHIDDNRWHDGLRRFVSLIVLIIF